MKKCYIVTWELSTEATRNALTERLKAYGWFCPIHQNRWAIMTENTAAQIRDHLKPILAPTDRIFVIRSGTEAAWTNPYGTKNAEWLVQYL